MRLSTKGRYGTRMMLDLAKHYDRGAAQIGDVARREDISVKYLEQLIIPLKKAGLIESVRGLKGGHMLGRPLKEITVGEIVRVLEGGISLTDCIENPDVCGKTHSCLTRTVLWEDATQAMYPKLDGLPLRRSLRIKRVDETKKMRTYQ